MGRLFQKLLPLPLLTSNTRADNLALIAQVDIVIVGVPIHQTVQVMEEIAPHLREDQLFTDITSLKVKPCEAMLKAKSSVIGMHPIFGPTVDSFEGQNIVLCPLRPGPWKERLTDLFEGARFVETTPTHHDQVMALIQALSHFLSLTFMTTLEQTGSSLKELWAFASPLFRAQALAAGHILSESSRLYADILLENPAFPSVMHTLEESLASWKRLIQSKDKATFISQFEALASFTHKLPTV